MKPSPSRVASLKSASTFPVTSVATAIVNESGQVLILRRGSTAPWMPGKWSLPGGVVDPGEGLRQAAIREAVEETTLRVRSASPLAVLDHAPEEWAAAFFVTGPGEWSGTVKLDYENDAYAWISASEIGGYSFIPTVKKALMKAFRSSSARRVASRWLEAAKPTELDTRKTYYHGTSEKAAKEIMRNGIEPPDLSLNPRHALSPVKGKVYITPHLGYARIYGSYIFVIPGKELREIQPDEDSIGEMVYKRNPRWLHNLAEEVLSDMYSKHPERVGLRRDLDWDFDIDRATQEAYLEENNDTPLDLDDEDSLFEFADWLEVNTRYDDESWWEYNQENIYTNVMGGEYIYWAMAGKILLAHHLTDEQQLDLINEGAHIAHEGKLKPSGCWTLPSGLSPQQVSDADFFRVAEKCR